MKAHLQFKTQHASTLKRFVIDIEIFQLFLVLFDYLKLVYRFF